MGFHLPNLNQITLSPEQISELDDIIVELDEYVAIACNHIHEKARHNHSYEKNEANDGVHYITDSDDHDSLLNNVKTCIFSKLGKNVCCAHSDLNDQSKSLLKLVRQANQLVAHMSKFKDTIVTILHAIWAIDFGIANYHRKTIPTYKSLTFHRPDSYSIQTFMNEFSERKDLISSLIALMKSFNYTYDNSSGRKFIEPPVFAPSTDEFDEEGMEQKLTLLQTHMGVLLLEIRDELKLEMMKQRNKEARKIGITPKYLKNSIS